MTYSDERRWLCEHLRRQGIESERVLEAIERTPRHEFVPEHLHHLAYADEALPIGSGQTISQPYIVALMSQELELTGDETVLEIGTGSGYQAAILAMLCHQVVTIERHESLAVSARELLGRLGHTNIEFRSGDGTLGCPERAPFDGIIVTAAAPDVPAPLYNQLAVGGRLVIPVGDSEMQTLQQIVKRADGLPHIRNVCGCRFVKLIGEAGWEE